MDRWRHGRLEAGERSVYTACTDSPGLVRDELYGTVQLPRRAARGMPVGMVHERSRRASAGSGPIRSAVRTIIPRTRSSLLG